MPVQDPYAVLGVSRGASADEIKSAYRKLARQFHPDVNKDPGAEDRFKEIGEAYAILSDADRKAHFDRYGSTDSQGFGGAGAPGDFFGGGGIDDIFDAFFGGGGGRGRASRVRNGDDVQAQVTLRLDEVLEETEKPVKYRRSATCPTCDGAGTADKSPPKTCSACGGSGAVTVVKQTFIGSVRTTAACGKCRGTGQMIENPCATCHGEGVAPKEEEYQVVIPAGIDSGQTLRVAGKGSDGARGGIPGDLYVVVTVQDDKRFERQGKDLVAEVSLTFAQAVIGDKVEMDGLTGPLEVSVDTGTQPGDVLRVKGEGLPPLHGGPRGDLYVEVTVDVPKKLSEAERKILLEWAELRGEPVPQGPAKDGFFGSLFKRRK